MSAILRNLHQVWEQLRSQKTARPDYLDQVQIKSFRGISDLRVHLPFPVCVLAGANGCGKSTVLFSLASAYGNAPSTIAFTPARLFPNFKPQEEKANLADNPGASELVFAYTAGGQPLSMAWKRGKKWDKSFFGRKRGSQPQRAVYLHTLSKLTNPSEIRSVIQLAFRKFDSNEIDASNIAFAQRVLGFRYARLTMVRNRNRDLLVAERADTSGEAAVRYSEFHMSAGERAVIRLSINLSKLENALVLIDEVEAGLHPMVQQLLMLELQRLALRNQLQIVCTTHSPAVLDTVPIEARLFLERVSDNVVRREAYRDIIQKALYGRSQDVLSFLCEDEETEYFLRGLLDHLGPKLDLLQNDIEVGRNTGKDQYLAHLDTLARFRKLGDVVFVLDGDGQEVKAQLEQRAATLAQSVRVLCLPGKKPPEIWAWELLQKQTDRYASFFNLDPATLTSKLRSLDDIYSNAADKPVNIAKNKIYTLVEEYLQTSPNLFRHLAKIEAENGTGDVFELLTQLEDSVRSWRTVST